MCVVVVGEVKSVSSSDSSTSCGQFYNCQSVVKQRGKQTEAQTREHFIDWEFALVDCLCTTGQFAAVSVVVRSVHLVDWDKCCLLIDQAS